MPLPSFGQLFSTSTSQPAEAEASRVKYVLSFRDSKNDRSLSRMPLTESDYDAAQRPGASSVLEMRKDVTVEKNSEGGGGQLRIIAIEQETMVIYSPRLLKLIPDVVGYYPGQKVDGMRLDEGVPRMVVNRPFRMLGGALERLTQKKFDLEQRANSSDASPNGELDETIKDLGHLLHELRKVLESPLQEEGQLHEQGQASFDMLWVLFRPGTEVYTKVHEEWTCCRVHSLFWESTRTGEDSVKLVICTIRMWYLDFDGTQMQRKSFNAKIVNYAGSRSIVELPAYPVQYLKDRDSVLERLESRGRKFLGYLQQHAPQLQYNGYIFTKQNKASQLSERQYYEGRVIVDPIYHARENGVANEDYSWLSNADQSSGTSSTDKSLDGGSFTPIDPIEAPKELDPSYYRVFPAYVRGFILGTRRWVWLHLDALRACIFNAQIMDHLQLEAEPLSLIEGYTPNLQQYLRADRVEEQVITTDPVPGKGEGRIMLLYGHPGTGKTFTVECISEATKRPLLRLSCKELGLDPVTLEGKLWKWFQRAKEWQGILLIDEADIFLRRRGRGDDLAQQAVVVAFLRSLEYYRGNLFLTANLWLKFDEAVLSRVSCVIEMQSLKPFQRKILREKHEKRIRSLCNPRYEITSDAAATFATIDSNDSFNGRDIKNFYHTVLILATGNQRKMQPGSATECVRIMQHDVDVVMKNMQRLKSYQERVRIPEDPYCN